jgi:hypothetical protein
MASGAHGTAGVEEEAEKKFIEVERVSDLRLVLGTTAA